MNENSRSNGKASHVINQGKLNRPSQGKRRRPWLVPSIEILQGKKVHI